MPLLVNHAAQNVFHGEGERRKSNDDNDIRHSTVEEAVGEVFVTVQGSAEHVAGSRRGRRQDGVACSRLGIT